MKHLVILLFVFIAFQLKAQTPFIENYGPKTYKAAAQNWCIAQDKNGIMYFGNSDALLEYDGSTWRHIPIPGNTARAIHIAKDGTVYLGARADMGYLATNKHGKRYFVSLKKYIPKQFRNVNSVWYIFSSNDTIYFSTENYLYIYYSHSESFKVIKLQANQIMTFWINHTLYLQLGNYDVLYLRNGKLLNCNFLTNVSIKFDLATMLPYRNNKIMAVTRKKGILIYDPTHLSKPKYLNSEAQDWIKKNPIFHNSCVIRNAEYNEMNYAFASNKGGIIVINSAGKIIERINKLMGLRKSSIYSLFQDNRGALWAGMSNGIAKIDVNYPFNIYDEHSGLPTPILSICRYKGMLFVGTNLGLFYLNKQNQQFKPVKQIITQCWKMEVRNNRLIVDAGNAGLYFVYLDKNKTPQSKSVFTNPSALMDYTFSRNDSDIIFCAMYNAFIIAKIEENKVIEIGRINDVPTPCYQVCQQKDGTLWMRQGQKGFYRISFSGNVINQETIANATVKKYNTKSTDNQKVRYKKIIKTGNLLRFLIGNSIYRYDKKNDKFEQIPDFRQKFHLTGTDPLYFTKDKNGNYWFPTTLKIARKNLNHFTMDSLSLKPLQNSCSLVYFDKDSTVWLANSNGLYHYFPKKNIKYSFAPTLIRKVTLTMNDSTVFYGAVPTQKFDCLNPTLSYNHNSIEFQYSALSYDFEAKTKYKYFLQGYDKQWSNWTKDLYKEYTNLPEGKYTFHVKSKSAFGLISPDAIYHFKILPPWYRTIWAYIAYLVLFILLIYGIIKISLIGMSKAKKKLEKAVIERTQEISNQKKEIEEKNKNILASIEYAKNLQNAILPSITTIKKCFKDSFVFFQPKDIVSGDFYWLAAPPSPQRGEQNQVKNNQIPPSGGRGAVFIAAADCTGHGVPGAMMSIFCSNALHHVVNELNIKQPAEILDKTRQILIEHYTKDNKTISDGMDIALCKLTYEKNKITLDYAGANNPVWIINPNKTEWTKALPFGEGLGGAEIKPDKQPVGHYPNMKKFTNHTIEVHENDIIYIFSDGYADQFGGEQGKKYKYSRLKTLLLSIAKYDLITQKEMLRKDFNQWKGNEEQVDDVCIIGIKV